VPGIVFDTNIWIAYRPTRFPRSLQMSVVVLQELICAPDSTSVARYEALKRHYEAAGKLLVPTADDWVLAGRVLNALLRGKKSKNRGKTPRLPDHEKQRIIRDVLIARSGQAYRRYASYEQPKRLQRDSPLLQSSNQKRRRVLLFLKRSRRRDKLEACPTSAGSNNSNLTTHA